MAAFFAGLRRSQSESRAEIEVIDRSSTPVKIMSPGGLDRGGRPALYEGERPARTSALRRGLYEHWLRPLHPRCCCRARTRRAGRWWWETDEAKECGLHFTPEGRVERTVDVLLREILERASV